MIYSLIGIPLPKPPRLGRVQIKLNIWYLKSKCDGYIFKSFS